MKNLPDFVAEQGRALIAHRLRRLSERFVDGYGSWLPEAGVTVPPRTLSTLFLLEQEESLTVTEIGARLRLSHPLIIKMIDHLSQTGVVEARPDALDGRRRRIRLTDAGRRQAALARDAAAVMADAYATLFEQMGVDLLDCVVRAEEACADQPFDARLRRAAASARRDRP